MPTEGDPETAGPAVSAPSVVPTVVVEPADDPTPVRVSLYPVLDLENEKPTVGGTLDRL